jgi:hypothetical protein
MRKGLYLVLSLLVALSLGIVFIHCSDDDGCKCPTETDECCTECPCPDGQICENGTCVPDPCCPDAPAGEYHVWVSGMTIDMTTQLPAAAAVAAISPMDALTEENPTKLAEEETGADGAYKTDCFDVTEVALGVVMMTDDIGWDGAAGTYFPTGSGAKGWDTNAEKECAENTKSWLVPTTLVQQLDAATSVDSAGFGFIMGLVVNATTGSPVEGAVLKKGDGSDLVEVIYPTATGFDGTATAATGLFVLPHTNFAAGITEIVAEKTGMTFGAEKAAPKEGFCYFVYIIGQ